MVEYFTYGLNKLLLLCFRFLYVCRRKLFCCDIL
eukprot:XP_001707048.1 Hypothetical protein GL50803_39241 [Giardia lamblia ATCC 50803]